MQMALHAHLHVNSRPRALEHRTICAFSGLFPLGEVISHLGHRNKCRAAKQRNPRFTRRTRKRDFHFRVRRKRYEIPSYTSRRSKIKKVVHSWIKSDKQTSYFRADLNARTYKGYIWTRGLFFFFYTGEGNLIRILSRDEFSRRTCTSLDHFVLCSSFVYFLLNCV